MKKMMLFIMTLALTKNLFATPSKILACSEIETAVLKDRAAEAIQLVRVANENKDKIYTTLVSTYGAPDSVAGKARFGGLLTCIDRKLSFKRYEMRCMRVNSLEQGACKKFGMNYGGYVDGGSIIRSHFAGNGHVNICENSITPSIDLTALIVHEVAHLCLAQDLGYFEGLSDPTLQRPDWHNNADSYRNIVKYLQSLL